MYSDAEFDVGFEFFNQTLSEFGIWLSTGQLN